MVMGDLQHSRGRSWTWYRITVRVHERSMNRRHRLAGWGHHLGQDLAIHAPANISFELIPGNPVLRLKPYSRLY